MFIGIDLGTRYVKIAFWDNGKLDLSKIDTPQFYRQYKNKEGSGINLSLLTQGSKDDVLICSTGYGREAAKVKGAKAIPEIIAHTKGTSIITGLSDYLLIDLGGQDSKVISVRNKIAEDFLTNDRCAASTGRYLENMAGILGISIEELSLHKDNPAPLSSVFAVFVETELLSFMENGVSIESLSAGVNHSLFLRLESQIKSFKHEHLVITGGVARNTALSDMISESLGSRAVIPPVNDFTGALGCLFSIINDGCQQSQIVELVNKSGSGN
jgi:predicted CoA-substrate-specific enzyme activase